MAQMEGMSNAFSPTDPSATPVVKDDEGDLHWSVRLLRTAESDECIRGCAFHLMPSPLDFFATS